MGHGTSERPCATQKAGAIAPATAPRCPLARRGPQPPASAHPAPGGRFPPAGGGRSPLILPDLPVYRAPPRAGGETRVSFPVPARTDDSHAPASMAGAIAPATAPRRDQDQPGAKAPGQRPPRHRRALPARRAGRWPLLFQDLPVHRAPSSAGGGNAGRVSCFRPN